VEGERATFGEPRIIGKKYEDGVAIGSAQELRERWNDLRFQVELRDNAQFPKVLIWLVTVVAALLISGCVLPLIALGEPSNAQQLLALSPFTALSLTIGAIGFRRAQKAFQTWKAVEVWQRVRDELEDERLHEEAWEEQDTREREERERAAADDAD
jgi:hypothetical protein